jgi:hypothetical protein
MSNTLHETVSADGVATAHIVQRDADGAVRAQALTALKL